jgi:flagellin-like hook-associated protein FlgL
VIHTLHKISLQQRWQETKGAPEKKPQQDKISEITDSQKNSITDQTVGKENLDIERIDGCSSIAADPTEALRINNSLRLLTTAISRISRQRNNLGGRISSLKKTIENLSFIQESPPTSNFLSRQTEQLQESLSQIKQQIKHENTVAVMAHHNLDQQRVLGLLYDQKTGADYHGQPG